MKILVAGFQQETNTFSPVLCDIDVFRRTNYLEGNAIVERYIGKKGEMSGVLECIQDHGDTAIPAVFMTTNPNGRVDQAAADEFLEKTYAVIDREKPDAIVLVMHGGMAINNGFDDGGGYIYSRIRQHVGPEMVITASHDMHSNITKENVTDINAIAGYRTYPHADMKMTGYRAASLAYRFINQQPTFFSCVKIPMIVPAEGYTSESGVFHDLIQQGEAMQASGKILDFSIFQMQPWLNVKEAGSAVTVAAETQEAADQCAKQLAHGLFDIRKEMGIKLYDIDEVIDKALENKTDMPVIVVDSADSTNAGSCADSSFVIEHLLERNTDLHCAVYICDGRAAAHAFEVGVGNTGTFQLGGTMDPAFQKTITVEATVRSLHDGHYIANGTSVKKGFPAYAGTTAVLQVGNIDILVMQFFTNSAKVKTYRAFGIDPAMYDLVVVKSANQYKIDYSEFSNLFYPTDTPGSSTANLVSLPFDRIPRPFYPFDEIEDFDDTPI